MRDWRDEIRRVDELDRLSPGEREAERERKMRALRALGKRNSGLSTSGVVAAVLREMEETCRQRR